MLISFRPAYILFVVLLLSACGGEEPIRPLSAEDRFSLAMAKYKNEDYQDALEDFKIVTLQFQGTKFADQAQFYMGECHYKREEFILAAYEYDILIRTMSTSRFVSKARYARAMCYYNLSPGSSLDQDYSRKAIDEFQAFLEYSPTDSIAPNAESKITELNVKLAKKEYENGMTYMHLEYYKAATLYFDQVIEKYHDTPIAELARYRRVEALFYRKKYSDAQKEINDFLSRYSTGTMKVEAERLKASIEVKLAEDRTKEGGTSKEKQNTLQTIPQNRQ